MDQRRSGVLVQINLALPVQNAAACVSVVIVIDIGL